MIRILSNYRSGFSGQTWAIGLEPTIWAAIFSRVWLPVPAFSPGLSPLRWAWYARMVRGIVLSLRHREFLLAARMSGAGPTRTFMDHLLPATLSQLVVLATLDIGHIMLHVSGLSFLRLGVTPPTAEWGVMINDARQYVRTAPSLILWPGLTLFISVMAFNQTTGLGRFARHP